MGVRANVCRSMRCGSGRLYKTKKAARYFERLFVFQPAWMFWFLANQSLSGSANQAAVRLQNVGTG